MHPVGTKTIPETCKADKIAYCPTMDLVALTTESHKLHVFRLNGQRVFGASFEDSQVLAVSCTDNHIRLISASSGKTVHQLSTVPQSATTTTTCLGWAVNFTDSPATQRQLDDASDEISLDDLLGLNVEIPTLLKSKANFPRELALIDIETSLPKLSTLPATGAEDDFFSSRASIDAIFHAPNRATHNDCVDVLLAGFNEGTVHLRIFDCFEIGLVSLVPSLPSKPMSCKPRHHAFHPMTATHVLAVQTTPVIPEHGPSLHIIALDLNFIPATAPYYLPTLASKSAQLQNLLQYVAQTETQLTFEVKSAFDLPSKYLRNINESLAEHANGADFVTAAYHLIVTGECIPQLREWLVDEVGERGLKRWEKSVLGGLETMRRIVHECLLPALERCQVVLSRLEGLSRFQKAAVVLGLDVTALGHARESVDCLNLLGHDLLKVVGKEMREFAAFLKWLRLETEVQGLELGSERAEELREGSDTIEYRVVLDYVSGPLRQSGTTKYLQKKATDKETDISSTPPPPPPTSDESGYYEAYKKARRSPEAGQTLPKLDELVGRLKRQCSAVFDRIAGTLRKSILTSYLCGLPEECDPEVLDMRIIPSRDNPDVFNIHVMTKHITSKSAVNHTRLQGRKSGSNLANIRQVGSRLLFLHDAGQVRDLKFVDDAEFVVLTCGKHVSHIHSQTIEGAGTDWITRHTFDHDGPATERPAKLEVNGRKGRRVVCVLNEQRTQYTVFDFDNSVLEDAMHSTDNPAEDSIDQVMTG